MWYNDRSPRESRAGKSYMLAAALCLLTLLAAALAGLSFGSSSVSLGAFLKALIAGDTKSTAYRIMMHSRLLRVLGAMLCGGALAVAGVILQAVLLNPLAGPNTIGVNNGAGLLVLLCSAFLPEYPQLLPLAAFLGALATACLVFSVSIGSGVSKVTLVLAGVAMSSILGAGMNCILIINPDAYVGASTFLVGGLATVTMKSLRFACGYIAAGLVLAMLLRRDMNVISLGEDTARALGMPIRRTRFFMIMTAAVLVGAAVSFCGMIGFVGLIVPHIFRHLVGSDHRRLVPCCALGGAAFVTLCDLASRILFAPYEVPVGILLSFIGGPFFIWLIVQGRRGRHG